jgi:uncharacterized OsmC-like protein/fermentation-respiration switch protein FrsA (DUF1100 family)
MPSLKVEFPGSFGAPLAARLDLPDTLPRAFALFAHCFTCSKESRAPTHIGRALVEQGIALLRFDFTGLGGSEGEFENTSFSSNAADLVAAADWLRREHAAPSILIGHSLGGTAVLAAAGQIPEARAVLTLNAPHSPEHVIGQFAEYLARIEREGVAEVSIAGRPFRVGREFVQDVAGHRLDERIRELRRPLLIMHAPTDTVVGIDNATSIYMAARHPKSFVSLDGADHLLTRSEDARYAAQVLAAWVSRYLPAPTALPSVPAGTVRVTERRLGKFTTLVQTPMHAIYADEPTALGGNDTGMSPYELLAAALGTCTVMTLRMYADRKGLALERASVVIEHQKIHAADCAECETREGKVDRLRREVTLEGELSDEQRASLLEIAARCPVHRTLESEINVVTALAG